MAVWILTQMKRWGQIKGDIDFKAIADQVFLQSVCDLASRQMGYPTPNRTDAKPTIMGKSFDASKAGEYLDSFRIGKKN